MIREEVYEFLRRNPFFSLATCDNDTPHCRMMRLYDAGADGLVFAVIKDSELNHELKMNPTVEMCFYSAAEDLQIRVSGTVEFVENTSVRSAVSTDLSKHEAEETMEFDVYAVRGGKAVESSWYKTVAGPVTV